MIWIILILIIALFSYREVQILIDRGSWRAADHRNIFWYIEQKGFKRLLDSFHVSNGFATLLIIWLIRDDLWTPIALYEPLYIGLYWLIWFQIRNLFMRII